jgi:NitT/TauT family transport system permease protein
MAHAAGQGETRRRAPSVPVDVGLVAVVTGLVALLMVGSSHLRPHDAPELDPRPALLPIYLMYSLARLLVAYALSVLLALAVGHLAARSRVARRVILPALDVLQSVPILGFFPAAAAVFIALGGGSALGVEAAAVFLIFTSMFWNLAFGVYGSLITVPEELLLAADQLKLRGTLRWTRLVLPAVFPNLLYNSILSWSNGWYFLIASEIIAAGPARYTLPGLGSYLSQAIAAGHRDQTLYALLTLLAATVGLRMLVWGPLETWAERFLIDESGEHPRVPRIGRLLQRSRIVRWLSRQVLVPLGQMLFRVVGRVLALPGRFSGVIALLAGAAVVAGAGWLAVRAAQAIFSKPLSPEAREIPLALGLSLLRVAGAVALAVIISVPVAWLSLRAGPHGRTAAVAAVQVLGSFPATAFFPLVAAALVPLGLGLEAGSVLLVLTAAFLYVMLNALSGAASVPKELMEAASAFGLRGLQHMRRVFIPAVLPQLVTGAITAWGGAWNAIVLAEYVTAGGQRHVVTGIGASLDRATYETGDAQVIALSLLAMVTLVVAVNRVFWAPLYRQVGARYKMDA